VELANEIPARRRMGDKGRKKGWDEKRMRSPEDDKKL